MAGWLPVRRTPREHPNRPLPGYKLAHPMLSADGTRAGFAGVSLGRGLVYGVRAEAQCAHGARHRRPARWCDCGFYCVHSLDEVYALACDPEYRHTVLLTVAASGRFVRYQRGLRYERQRVTSVRVGRCGCGEPAQVFTEAGTGSVGWRRLLPLCPGCAGGRPRLPLQAFAGMLGVPVTVDESVRPLARAGEDGTDAEPEALVPLLTAEVALLQARLDEVQRRLNRLTP